MDVVKAKQVGIYDVQVVKARADLDLSFLCRFEGTLTPKQMREDLMLTLAADRKPYRKHIIT